MVKTLPEESAEVVAGIVRETVLDHRSRGLKTPHAIEDAALSLGISPRRARGFFYRQIFNIPRREYLAIMRRFVAYLDADARAIALLAEAKRERAAQLSQFSLDVGDTECSTPSGVGSRNCGGAGPSGSAIAGGPRSGARRAASFGRGWRESA